MIESMVTRWKQYHNNMRIKEELKKWIDDTYKPNYMLTIQFHENIKSSNLYTSIDNLKRIMKQIECNILGRHWNKKHLQFIAFAE